MARIIPKLNLNKHPQDVDNYSIVDAENVRISDYSGVLQSEESLKYADVYNKLSELYEGDFKIVHIINCLNELIIFIDIDDNIIHIARYNENLNECKNVGITEYFDKVYDSCYAYNNENLFIYWSANFVDYDNNPLRTINLGSFDDEYDKSKYNNYTVDQTILPKVHIPTITCKSVKGTAYKGNYFIFIRFKVNKNDYTQWFNTNVHILLDATINTTIIDYYISTSAKNDKTNDKTTSTNTNCFTYTSTDNDLCSKTISLSLNKVMYYEYYQIGLICITKSYTKCFRTNDIAQSKLDYTINFRSLIEYDAAEMIKTYNNYYNVQNICTSNERIYITNYDEQNESLLEEQLKDINCTIKATISSNNSTSSETTSKKATVTINNSSYSIDCNYDETIGYYVNLYDWYFWWNDYNFVNTWKPTLDNVAKYYDVKTETNHYAQAKCIKIGIPSGNLYINDQKFDSNYFVVQISQNTAGGDDGYDSSCNSNVYGDYTIYSPKSYIGDGDININIQNESEEIKESNINKSFIPYQYYNFFIHFVNQYGETSKGYNITKLNVTKNYINLIGECFYVDYISNDKRLIDITFTLDKIPDGYIGYYLSMEKLEKNIIYNGIVVKTDDDVRFYCDEINYNDSINFNFNCIRVYQPDGDSTSNLNISKKYKIQYLEYGIEKKELYVADSYNNVLKSTNIKLTLETRSASKNDEFQFKDGVYYAQLINSSNNYTEENKILIPCTNVCYDTNKPIVLTPYSYYAQRHAIIWKENVYYDNTVKYFKYSTSDSDSDSGSDSGSGYILNICKMYSYYCYSDTVEEYLSLNNTPVITFFPIVGLDETDYKKKSFKQGCIVECKNTVDLFQQKHSSVFDMHPKTMTNYNENIEYQYTFNNVVRRSNIFQNESNINSGRWFDTNGYKYITFKKGTITNILFVGIQFLIHTEHSIFAFQKDNTINQSDKTLQIGSQDIWDVDYTELMPTEYGYAGINDNMSWICGTYGYIYYSKDDKRIYQYDNNKLKTIDDDIMNYIHDLDAVKMIFVEDNKHSRILIEAFDEDNSIVGVFSYNYNYNMFVSMHNYNFTMAYNTKNNIYLVQNNKQIKDYDNNLYQSSNVSIMINPHYEILKYLEFITYKIYQIDGSRNIYIEDHNKNYHPEIIKITTDLCDTGNIDATINYENCNKPTDYKKPYWRMGNWHFNALRNNIAYYKGYDKNNNANKSSRIYGNWFVIKFISKSNKRIEYETIDAQTKSAELI